VTYVTKSWVVLKGDGNRQYEVHTLSVQLRSADQSRSSIVHHPKLGCTPRILDFAVNQWHGVRHGVGHERVFCALYVYGFHTNLKPEDRL
jgi:hypothetical protein